MTRLSKWRWAWELDEDNWSWRRLITGDSWLIYMDEIYCIWGKWNTSSILFFCWEIILVTVWRASWVLSCVSQSPQCPTLSCVVTNFSPRAPNKPRAPRRANGISLASCLSSFFWYIIGLHLSWLFKHTEHEKPPQSDVWTPICNIHCWVFPSGHCIPVILHRQKQSKNSDASHTPWEGGGKPREEKGPPDTSRTPWMTPCGSSLVLEI